MSSRLQTSDYQTTVPCQYCDTHTRMTGTRLCDRCWELQRRIRYDLELAEKIIAEIRGQAPEPELHRCEVVRHAGRCSLDEGHQGNHAFIINNK